MCFLWTEEAITPILNVPFKLHRIIAVGDLSNKMTKASVPNTSVSVCACTRVFLDWNLNHLLWDCRAVNPYQRT